MVYFRRIFMETINMKQILLLKRVSLKKKSTPNYLENSLIKDTTLSIWDITLVLRWQICGALCFWYTVFLLVSPSFLCVAVSQVHKTSCWKIWLVWFSLPQWFSECHSPTRRQHHLGNLLEVQILWPLPRSIESEILGVQCNSVSVLKSPAGGPDVC